MSNNTPSAASTDAPLLQARMAAARRNRLRRYASCTLLAMYFFACIVGAYVGEVFAVVVATLGLAGTAIFSVVLKPESQHPRDCKK